MRALTCRTKKRANIFYSDEGVCVCVLRARASPARRQFVQIFARSHACGRIAQFRAHRNIHIEHERTNKYIEYVVYLCSEFGSDILLRAHTTNLHSLYISNEPNGRARSRSPVCFNYELRCMRSGQQFARPCRCVIAKRSGHAGGDAAATSRRTPECGYGS